MSALLEQLESDYKKARDAKLREVGRRFCSARALEELEALDVEFKAAKAILENKE